MSEFLSSISLNDVLAEPTLARHLNSSDSAPELNNLDFDMEAIRTSRREETPIAPEPEYNAQEEATKLVNLLNAGNTLLVTPIANIKMRKNRGGKKALDRMKAAYMKKNRGTELSEQEQQDLAAFEAYKSDLAILNGEIPFTKPQLDTLVTCAIPYCESRKLKVNSDFAFWGVYAGLQLEKITKILLA